MAKFKPNFLPDEQMFFSDAKITLLYQIREELKELNSNLKGVMTSESTTSRKSKSDSNNSK